MKKVNLEHGHQSVHLQLVIARSLVVARVATRVSACSAPRVAARGSARAAPRVAARVAARAAAVQLLNIDVIGGLNVKFFGSVGISLGDAIHLTRRSAGLLL